ncbi:hypothetical protein G3A56_09255 [Rhizobium oryzihabitans]|uniref:Uncharacterized protein n=1 Tax=Rhizobium oryzihabitans TaxID=2267833 RepID=A0A7L5BGW0_9HYPH|nr:hypothetical protein [Rhizobium oryzihabitans]QIB38154.1 hypothetical protein G3A56_09255 [Rhizobium oryzihabitans]
MQTDPLGDDFRAALEKWGRDQANVIAVGITLELAEADAQMRNHFMQHGADADEIDSLVVPTMRAALLKELMVIVEAMQINRPMVQ